MWDFFSHLFDSSGFPPRWNCGAWTTGHGWLHILSDLGVWSAYFVIPCVLGYYALKRKDIPFRSVFLLFVGFILACGLTHLMEAVIFWWPAYRLAGILKLLTALISWVTVFALIRVTPQVMALRSPAELETEIAGRRRVEGDLRALHANLEGRIVQRTSELEGAVTALKSEIETKERIERQLWESREQLRLVTDNAPVLLVHCDLEHRYKFVNRAYAECNALTPGEVVGKRIPEVVGEQAYKRLLPHVDAALAGEQVQVEVESPYKKTLGRLMHYTFLPQRSDSGSVQGFLAVILDVTELRKAETLLRTITDTIPSLISCVDMESHYRLNNRAYEQWFGQPRSEMAGRHMQDVLGQEAWAVIGPKVKAALAGQTIRFEAQVPYRSGGMRWVDATYTPHLDAGGVVGGVVGLVNDITDKKKSETALQESEARFHLLANSIPQLAWTARPDGHIFWYNQRWYDYTGTTPNQMEGWGWQSVHDPVELPKVLERWQGTIATGERFEMVFPLRAADGQFRSFLTQVMPLHGSDGQVLQWFGTNTDITERIQAVNALRESEEQFRQLANTMPQIVWTARPDGHLEYFNERWYEYTGLPEEVGGDESWRSIIHPEDVDQCLEMYYADIRAGRPNEMEFRLKNGCSGGYRWHLGRALPVRDNRGSIVRWFGTYTDIHEKKLAEEELRGWNATLEHRVAERIAELEERGKELRDQTRLLESILYSMGEGVVVADESGKFLLFNPAAERLLGVGVTNSPVGEWSKTYRVFSSDNQTEFPPHQLPLAMAIRGEPADNIEMVIRNPKLPTEINLIATGRPLYADDATVWGGVVVIHDITARKQAEEQTRASLREKEVLLKEIHHRVKNNLQIVSTLLDLQSGHTNDREAMEMFKESRGRVRSMALIHERLYRSQDMARVNFAEYVRQLADDLHRTYKVSDDIQLELDVDIPPLTIDIAIPCGLLLNELMSNCLKHAFLGRTAGCIRIALHQDEGANILIVADDGAGFPADTDFRNTTSFGLQLVNTLVDQLNGEISLTTDKGTTFTTRFPKTK